MAAVPIETIETALRDLLQGIRVQGRPFFAQVTGYEDGISPKPQAQLYFVGATLGGNADTSGVADVGWRFMLEMFFGGSLREAMADFRAFYAQWPSLVLTNQGLAQGVLGWTWEDGPAPEFDGGVYAVLEIVVTTEEGD